MYGGVRGRMRIIEIFHSFQGEGPLTGARTAFIRTARCNLRCTWCDTTYSFGEGSEASIQQVLDKIAVFQTKDVCLTGGEPLLQPESLDLTRRLSEGGYRTVIETGGSLDIAPYVRIPNTIISLDVKCPASGMQDTMRMENLSYLRPQDVVKFVIADRKDYAYAREFLRTHPIPSQVVFQPVWGSPLREMAEWVLADHLNVRLMLQEHKFIWGDERGH